jgi:hypothetical protein
MIAKIGSCLLRACRFVSINEILLRVVKGKETIIGYSNQDLTVLLKSPRK